MSDVPDRAVLARGAGPPEHPAEPARGALRRPSGPAREGGPPVAGTGRAEDQAPGGELHARAHTRQRIQSVALELFAERGYDKTSLREIAERLGVTKAALYYHFKSKEDIVASLVEDFTRQVDGLIAWGAALPATPQARAEVLSRYFGIVAGAGEVFRMLQHNQASVNTLAHEKNRQSLFRERMHALVGVLTEPDAPLTVQLRAAVALASVSFGCMFYADRAASPEELRRAVLDIAFELTGARPAEEPGASAAG